MKKKSKVIAIFPEEYALEVRQAIRMVVPEKELVLKSEDCTSPAETQVGNPPPAPPLTTALFNGG